MMAAIFYTVLDMSIAAFWPIMIVTLFRIFLKKVPHTVWCILWGIIALRLILPFSAESALSLLPNNAPVSERFANAGETLYSDGIPWLGNATQLFTSDATALFEMNAILISLIWSFGTLAMIMWLLISSHRFQKRVKERVWLKENIYLCDHISSPFILPGIRNPRIILPSAMRLEDMQYVIAHEKAHLSRLDHIWKIVGYLILAVYWWNPAVWLAYILFCRDLEFSCDEKVIKEHGYVWKKPYSTTLLKCSIRSKRSVTAPLAFSEVSVKKRLKAVLHYQKPTLWIIVTSVIVCTIVMICFLTTPIRTTVDADLDTFISQAILDREKSTETEERFACESHTVLAVDENGKETTVYLMVMYQEYSYAAGVLTHETGGHYPTIITVEEQSDGNYSLKDYLWKPKYTQEDWARFPWYVQGKLDTQNYVNTHSEACYRQAAEFFGIAYGEVSIRY